MDNIGRVYRKGLVEIFALQQVHLMIAEGEFAAIMGPSGSGKSTLLHILGCLDRPSHGRYDLDGINVSDLDDGQLSFIRNQKIGFVFQSFNLLPQYTALQNIESPLLYSPKIFSKKARNFQNSGRLWQASLLVAPEQEGKVRAREITERVGLGNRLHHRPSELSGGEMQRVAIARALVTQPRVIVADEPTGNLDSCTGREIMDIFRFLHDQGHTIIIVTHEQSIAAYAERIIFLKDGRIEREERVGSKQKAVSSKQRAGGNRTLPGVDHCFGHLYTPLTPLKGGIRTHEKGNSPVEGDVNGRSYDQAPILFPAYRLLPSACWILPAVLTTAIRGVLLHKLRSFLSVLGIVFGIGAIIAMLAIGAGARQEIIDQIALLGTDTISVKALEISEKMISGNKEQLSQGLTYGDVDRIARGSPFIEYLAPVREFSFQIQYQRQVVRAGIIGTTSEYQDSGNLHLSQGRFLTAADEREMQRVCVLGSEIQQELFAFQNPLGEMLKIRHDWFRVIGTLENKVLNQKKISSLQVRNVNKQVYIPLSTSSAFASPQKIERIQEISIRVDDPEHVDDAARLIRTILTRVHHGARDYEVVVPHELLKQSQQAQNVFNVVMGSIAGISLLVGGIGIMNIMLATVTERTREIGIRRAIGASRRMVLLQFLIETLVLTLVGGCLGVILGSGGAYLITMFAGWRTILSLQTILLAFSISAMIGIVFGLYPASQGAKMDPILALRYE